MKKDRGDLLNKKTHHYDFITTDLGYATLEIDLAPAHSIHEARERLQYLIEIITSILSERDTILLGYGVQPVTCPSPHHIAHTSRNALMIDIWRHENIFSSSGYGVDLHTINAACQTQVEVSEEEAIPVVNVLNATSGLRIALLANSPVWQSRVADYKALRLLFVDWCWPGRKQQLGMAPRFQSIEHYVDYIFDFRSLMVRRNQEWYQISNQSAFRQFFTDEQGQIGTTLNGAKERIFGEVEDVTFQSGLAWFNARLQPAYGTVEDRISCQQPPQNHLCASALTIGLVENYEELLKLVHVLSLDQWREIHTLACRHGMDFSYPGVNVNRLIGQMVEIADQGLRQRKLKEEIYLEPLYERVKTSCCPADEAIQHFFAGGVAQIVASNDMRYLL